MDVFCVTIDTHELLLRCMKDMENFNEIMNDIINALSEQGYDPYYQLYRYITENEINYITKHRNAREKIQLLDKTAVEEYVLNMKK